MNNIVISLDAPFLIIGKKVRFVFHVDLAYDEKDKFQERLIVVELESGLQFPLQQESQIIDPATGIGFIFPYVDSKQMKLVCEVNGEPSLISPIQNLIIPNGWKDECGLLLENGFVLHNGYSDWNNHAPFYQPEAFTMSSLVNFDVDNSRTI